MARRPWTDKPQREHNPEQHIQPIYLSEVEKSARLESLIVLATWDGIERQRELDYWESRGCFTDNIQEDGVDCPQRQDIGTGG